MIPYKKCLIAFDGSETSKYALQEFIRSTKVEKEDFTVISVYGGELSTMLAGHLLSSAREICEERLEQAIDIAKREGVSINAVCEKGHSYEKIASIAESGDYDLVVLGKKSTSMLHPAFAGSITSRIVGLCTKDVLVIPEEAHIGWKNILIAADGSPYSEEAGRTAVEIAKQSGGEVTALSVVNMTVESQLRTHEVYDNMIATAKSFTQDVKAKAVSSGIKAEEIIRDAEEVYKAIIDVASETRADMIVMGCLGRTSIRRILLGSTAERVLGHSHFPVLFVKPAEQS